MRHSSRFWDVVIVAWLLVLLVTLVNLIWWLDSLIRIRNLQP